MNRAAATLMLFLPLFGGPALAQGPAWSYAQYENLWVRPQADQEGSGWTARLSVPLTEALYLSASGAKMDVYFTDPAITQTETFESGSIGLGVHSTYGKAHAFGQLSYGEQKSEFTDGADQWERRESGATLVLGARWLVAPWLSFEPEGGVSNRILDAFGRVRIGVRLVPHVWLVGAYTAGHFYAEDAWTAGVRLAWRDFSGPRPRGPGARVVPRAGEPAPDRNAPLAAGQTLRTLRTVRLQVRPLAGAPEIAALPADTTLVLHESTRNDFGAWWRVTAGDREGWIRETDLGK